MLLKVQIYKKTFMVYKKIDYQQDFHPRPNTHRWGGGETIVFY